MTVNDSYQTFVLEQLGRVAEGIRGKAMFGGVGIYAGAHFFALLAQDTTYFKVNDSNRSDFEALGMGPFRPFGDGGEVMQYYELPADILEDHDRLAEWTEKAIAVAVAAKRRGKKR
ncbi:MAG: TfoX/Sxy family protein [Gemmatimonadales bacterium]